MSCTYEYIHTHFAFTSIEKYVTIQNVGYFAITGPLFMLALSASSANSNKHNWMKVLELNLD